MSKTVIKKTKWGTLFDGAGFEFILNKNGFNSIAYVDDKVTGLDDLIVTIAEAKRIIAEHTGTGFNTVKLESLRKELLDAEYKVRALETKIEELEDDECLDITESGYNVSHSGRHIRVGCQTIPFLFAKKLADRLR